MAKEGNGRVIGHDLDKLQHDVRQIIQELRNQRLAAAVEVDGKAEENRERSAAASRGG